MSVSEPTVRPALSEAKRKLLERRLRGQAVSRDTEAPVTGGLAIPRRPSAAGPAPLSFAQQRLWFLDRLDPGGSAYNLPKVVRIEGSLEVRRFERVLGEIVRRHEVLRTSFPEIGGRPVQAVARWRPVRVPRVDLRGLAPTVRAAAVLRLAAAAGRTPFELARGPLWRARLLITGPAEHVLLLTLHHAVSDGWSTGVLVRELGELYRAFTLGAPSPLPELPIQYADFAAWEREWLAGDVLASKLDYWRRKLAGVPPLELPTDRPATGESGTVGDRFPFEIPTETSRELERLARAQGTTVFTLLLTAYAVLLSRYTGEDDVCVGSPVAGRTRREIEPLIGFFVNTVALRTDLSGRPAFREALARVRETVLEAHDHQDLPFEKLVEELAPERDLDRAPLFQVMFSLLGGLGEAVELPGVRLSPIEVENRTAKFDLTISMIERGGRFAGSIEFRTALFDRSTIERLASHWRTILAGVAADPTTVITALPLLDEAEHRQLIAWRGSSEPAVDTTLDRWIEDRAAAEPEAVAVSRGAVQVSYGALLDAAERIAARLHPLLAGAGAEPRVGLCAERSPSAVAGLLGILRAGATYVPLDSALPDARLAFLIEDSQAVAVLTDAGADARLSVLAGPDIARLRLDAERPSESTAVGRTLRAPASGRTAYLIYTSGSTGTPKGVAVPHGETVAHCRAVIDEYALGAGERVLQFAAPGFDVSIEQIVPTLAAGAELVLREAEPLAPAELAAWLARRRVTVANLPTALWHRWAADPGARDAPPPALRLVIAGGEEMLAGAVRSWCGSPLGRVALRNGYGPTETVITATLEDPALRPDDVRVAIGRPLVGRTARVVDREAGAAPVGVLGELWLGGRLARGYAERPAVTAERFVPDPDAGAGSPGDRVYRTGDLARWRPDGRLEYLGRADRQVKLRGYRIELGEIESALAAHPDVAAAAVLAVAARAGGETRLAAYVVPAPGTGPEDGAEVAGRVVALGAWLADRLPEHMVPTDFAFLGELPLSPTGKVDRRALGAIEATPAVASTGEGRERAEVDPVVDLLRGIWETVLDRDHVPIDGDFFALGGHSLLATQVVSRIREAFGVELPLRKLFEAPRLRALAGSVGDALRTSAGTAAPPLERVIHEGPPPASFAQRRLWLLDRLEPGGSSYNVFSAVGLRGALDRASLAAAVRRVVARHETLRTTFGEVAGEPVQHVHPVPASARPIPLVDLAAVPAGSRRAALGRLLAAAAAEPFDLARGPLFEVRLVRLASDEHVLVVRMHHIVSDAWSRDLLVRELALGYRAAVTAASGTQPPPDLPELPVQYADFAAWQRRWLSGDTLDRQLGYWRDRLVGAPPLLDLPVDRPRPAVRDPRGGRQPVVLPERLADGLRALGRARSATLFMVLLAGFSALLRRLTGQDDLSIGSPIAGRNREEIEHLIGFFVNTVVLRTRSDGEEPFETLLERVREAALGAYEHQDLPFERLVEELAPVRSLDRTPLFQAVFALQTAGGERLELPGLELAPVEVAGRTVKFDLTLVLAERPGRGGDISGWLEYPTALFDATTVRRMIGHLETLLAGAVAAPATPLAALPLLARWQRAQLLEEWNDSASRHPGEVSIETLFAEQVERTPDAVAAVAGEVALTYRELDRRSEALAHRLRAAGVGAEGSETRVGLCLERSVELPIALLAILRAGGAFVPLDPEYPAARLAFMLEDARLSVLVAQPHLVGALPAHALPVVEIGVGAASDAGLPAEPARRLAGGDRLAYVMYTSGSTGRPNGVAVPHRGVVRLVKETAFARLGPEETFLQLAPISFDASTLEVWGPLLNGGRLAIFPAGPPSLADLGRTLGEQRVTTLWLTAGLFHQVVEEELPSLAGVRQLLAGGDVLSPGHVERVLRAAPGCRVIDGYGPTENTTFTTCHAMNTPADVGRPVPIGRPIAATRAHLFDPRFAPVPIGVEGDLWTAGDGLARGYWRRPALTAERFVPLPGTRRPGERLYRTGDRARHLADGRIEFFGRRDAQVKLRGFRIEPGEVEAILAEQPAVAEAVAVVREDDGEKRLVAYVVTRAGEATEPSAQCAVLREVLRERLPSHLVPSAVVVLDELPLSPNGKVDRKALPRPDAATPAAGQRIRPRNDVESTVAAIWEELLPHGPAGPVEIGVEDDFFELGGHSLLATRVLSRVRETFGMELPLRAFFERPTVAALARAVAEGAGGGAEIRLVRGTGPAPLSFSQRRLWFLDRLDPESPLYNVPVAVRLRGALDRPALARALAEVVRRHEVLRTRFLVPEGDGEPVQEAPPAGRIPLPVVELEALADHDRERVATDLVELAARRPFDLSRGPLLRALLLALGPEEHVLAVTLHHVASDGWSMGILTREVAALYGAFAAGRPSPLAELPIQYADYARWQRARFDEPALAAQAAFWHQRLEGAPDLELPTDRPRPPVAATRGGLRPLAFGAATSQAVRSFARRAGTTPFAVVLAGYQALLARYTGQDDLTVGTPVAGRQRVEAEGLIGFFVNTLVLRGRLDGEPSFATLVDRTRAAALEAFAHQDLPFESLVEVLEPDRRLDRTPLFQVMLAFQTAPAEPLAMPGLELVPFRASAGTAKFDLTLSLLDGGRGIAGTLEYRADLFDAATIDRLGRHLVRLLNAAVEEPDRPVAELEILDPAERAQLFAEWNDTAAPSRAGGRFAGIAARIAARAADAPDAVAVVWHGERTTYRQLVARAGRLAAWLRRQGVGPDVPVGLRMERSPDLVVAMLGVLGAGGAYVPLDPAYPAERIATIAADARPLLVLTDRDAAAEPAPAPGSARLAPSAIAFDAAEAAASGPPADPIAARLATMVDPDHVSHLIFTSGSTGRPKGVAIRHGATAALAEWAHRTFPGCWDGILAATSINFDLSVFELLVPLAAGGKVVLAEDALALASLPARHEVRTVNTVPSAIAELVRSGGVPASVERVDLAGEPLPGSLVEAIYAETAASEVWNLYGPSEDTTYSTAARIPRGAGSPSIGRPVGGTGAFLVDRGLRPVPLGAAGELYLSGAGLARGYWGRPALTAERFLPHPIAPAPGARAYRTGDLARYRPDGELLFLGRTDHQVKVRGFRIELGEIEEVSLRHPAIAEAVAATYGEGSGRGLVAYVVAPEGVAPPGSEELRSHLQASLPSYMVPGVIVFLDAVPRTPNGKVDRRRLPAPVAESGPVVAPRTWTEELVADIWARVLERDAVGVDESFFELGGHSLLATRVVTEVRQALGVELPIRTLFEAPTVAGFALRIEEAQSSGAGAGRPPIVAVPRGGPLPLSFAQLRFWFSQRLDPENPGLNVPSAIRLSGPLKVPALACAVAEIVRRHEVLRTTYPEVDGEPLQVIAPAPERSELPVVDLSGLSEPVRAAELRAQIDAEVARPFDLERGPVLRLALLREAHGDHVLVAATHHAVRDGWSGGLLRRELSTLYEAYAAGRPSPLPELPVQYADFAVWQRGWLQGEVLEEHLGYWRERLDGAPPFLDLPTDRPRPTEPRFDSAHLPVRFAPDTASEIGALARRVGVTPFMVFLAAYQVVLDRWTGQGDVSVGVPVAGRHHVEIEALVGCFINMLVMRAQLADRPSFDAFLGRVRDATLGAQQHQDMPFEKLVQALQPERSLDRFPLFQAMFTFQNLPRPRLGEAPSVRLSALRLETFTMRHDLSLTLGDDGKGYSGALTYRVDLFDRSTAHRFRGHLETLLAAIVAAPAGLAAPVTELPVLARSERQQLLEWRHAPAIRRPACGRLFHELFEARAADFPNATAVVVDDRALSYGALADAARDLALRLVAAGVGSGRVVAVAVERSHDLFVAMLGVLGAGGVYLPIDPALPRERIEFLLEDAGAVAIVARKGGVGDWTRGLAVVSPRPTAEPPSRGPGTVLPRVDPACLAYVIYTSGSTGVPKGVGVSHAAIVAHTRSVNEAYGLGADDRVVQYASTSFDASIEQIVPPLAVGATVVLRGPAVLAQTELARWLARHRATHADLPTAVWNRWALDPQALAVESTSLRKVGSGGEEMLAEGVRAWHGSPLREVALFNGYGPTETVITATRHGIPAAPASVGARVPIGRPMAGRTAVVVDAAGRPAPIGVNGELLLGGILATGYLGRPARTAERFVPASGDLENPGGGRLYRTGDLVRQRADGTLEFLGRIDRQVKIRGFRIELGEIETALARHPDVAEAVVVTRERAPGDRFLVAYLVARGDRPPTGRELARFLGESLPAPLVPSAFVVLGSLPSSSTGKIDRAALPQPELTAVHRTAPRDAVELALTQVWEELLGIPVGVGDDFFALGGHSLLAVSLVDRIGRRFARQLPLSELFKHPTLEGLAAVLRADPAARPTAEVVGVRLRDGGSGAPFFCVHPVGGTVFCYLDLARAVAAEPGGDRAFVALQATGEAPLDETIEETAARYVREVRRAHPEGPYLLGGWSYGGVVAYEMARQLEAAGCAVDLLALIDSELPRPGASEPQAADRLLDLVRDLEGLSGRSLEIDRDALRGLPEDTGRDRVLERAREVGALAPGVDTERLRSLAALRDANVTRLYRYRPGSYGGRVLLLRADDGGARPRSAAPWDRLAAAVETVPVPGDHYTALREPEVRTLAATLAERLLAVDPPEDGDSGDSSC